MAQNKQPYAIARTPITLEFDGTQQTKPLQEWCYHFNVSYVNARMRYTRGKRGMDIFKIQSDKTLEPNLRFRYNHDLADPVRKYTTSALVSFLPSKHRERFLHHTKRLGITEEKMFDDIIDYVLNRLDKQEQNVLEHTLNTP